MRTSSTPSHRQPVAEAAPVGPGTDETSTRETDAVRGDPAVLHAPEPPVWPVDPFYFG